MTFNIEKLAAAQLPFCPRATVYIPVVPYALGRGGLHDESDIMAVLVQVIEQDLGYGKVMSIDMDTKEGTQRRHAWVDIAWLGTPEAAFAQANMRCPRPHGAQGHVATLADGRHIVMLPNRRARTDDFGEARRTIARTTSAEMAARNEMHEQCNECGLVY